jgi:hypothetical protein
MQNLVGIVVDPRLLLLLKIYKMGKLSKMGIFVA